MWTYLEKRSHVTSALNQYLSCYLGYDDIRNQGFKNAKELKDYLIENNYIKVDRIV